MAVAALRPAACPQVQPDGRAAVLTVRSRRHRDLGRLRTQAGGRRHAVPCELVPGGVRKEITAARAARILEAARPAGAAAAARRELAGDVPGDLRRIGARMARARKKPAAAVKAAGRTLTEVFGAGPVIAAITLAEVRDVSRFCGRDHFAACDGTAPIEVSSGKRKVHRLSRRANRRHGHAVRLAAITRIRHRHSEGRACDDKKPAGAKTPTQALRALKRRISDAPCRHLRAGARRAAATAAAQLAGPGGQPGNDSAASAAGSHPAGRLFGKATPGPGLTPRPGPATQPKKRSSRDSEKISRTP